MSNPDTGHGATITFGTSGFTADFRVIGEHQEAGGKIDITHLGSGDTNQYLPQDTIDPGEIELELIFDSAATLPPLHTPETITITLPTPDGLTTPATLIGTGFGIDRTKPAAKTNELSMAKYKIAFDGLTGPDWTPAA